MLRRLFSYMGRYKKYAFLALLCITVESIFELLVPLIMADLVDVEAFAGGGAAEEIIGEAHSAGVKVIASNHDFHRTPPRGEIVSRLVKMQDMGADIAKIAVMPQPEKAL